MKNYRVNISEEAKQDVSDIFEYIAFKLCAPLAALNLNNALTEEFTRLRNFPLSGTVFTDKRLNGIYRWVKVKNYSIFYTVDEQTETVYIARILYSASNYKSILS